MSEEKQSQNFGMLAIKLGFTTLEQVDECIRLQTKMKELGVAPKKLGEIMLAKGYLSEDQIRKISGTQNPQQAAGPVSIQGYKIISKIGQGAMGAIYKALQISMDRVVAIKCLAPKYAANDKFRERFLREARAVARLNHPNIIQGIDVGESNSIHYFAMEHIDGPTVGELLKRGGAVDERRAVNIVTQIGRALNHAFNHGIIHRDIKPDNIMLTRDGIAKLCDLGLVKLPNEEKKEAASGTRPGASMGTPYYIAPEQARGEQDVDTRSDIYSLGATFYHMVTGTVPFPGLSAADVISKHLTEPLTPPRQRNPLVSQAVEAVVVKMMQKAREDRYQTPHDMVKELEAILQGRAPEPEQPAAQGVKTRGIKKKGTTSQGVPKIRRSKLLRRARRFRR